MNAPLRIALLTHSTNPRGGVVHALELGDALTALGHEVVVHAPAAPGGAFFRPTACRTEIVPASAASGTLADVVETRVGDFIRYFEGSDLRRFDLFHTGDGIGGNALANLKQRGRIRTFARTVHHLNAFDDPRLAALQRRSIEEADALFVVSRLWRERLWQDFGMAATLVGNGVDCRRFTPDNDANDAALTDTLGAKRGPVFLSLGGVEPRKNSRLALAAFQLVKRHHPHARWIVAGGATVLDHGSYRKAFLDDLARGGLGAPDVTLLGPLAQDEIPSLYRYADTLLFPSVSEGFGLAVIEAMACGTPVVASRIAPFIEYLGCEDAIWCNPADPEDIARAMAASFEPRRRQALLPRGFAVAQDHGWAKTAAAHLPVYTRLTEFAHA